MPSNKELTKQALELENKLNITVTTQGLSNAELAELVTDLKAKLKDADETTDEDVQAFPYSVAAGKSITSKRGIIGEGEEVKVDYLPGGKETLDSLVDRDFVVKG